jgi:hypothetical protein
MLIFDELDDRFYENNGVFAQREIAENEVILISGIAVKKNSIADSCTEFLNHLKFATMYSASKRDYEYFLIPLGFSAAIKSSDQPNVSLEYDNVGNIIFRFIRNVAIGEEILYKDES